MSEESYTQPTHPVTAYSFDSVTESYWLLADLYVDPDSSSPFKTLTYRWAARLVCRLPDFLEMTNGSV